MGILKQQMMDQQEADRDRRLAKLLGISYDELAQLGHELDEDTDKDGNVRALLVHFNENAPKHILAKIKPRLDGKKTAELDPNALSKGYPGEQ